MFPKVSVSVRSGVTTDNTVSECLHPGRSFPKAQFSVHRKGQNIYIFKNLVLISTFAQDLRKKQLV